MSKRREFYAIGGNLSYAVGQMAMLLAFSRLGTLTQLGLYTFALAVTAPIQLGFGMRLRSVRVVSAARSSPLSMYFVALGATSLVAIGISAVLGVLLMDTSVERLLFLVVASGKALDSMIDLTYGELQRLDRFDLLALSQVFRSVVMAATTVAALSYGKGAIGVAIAVGITSLAILVLWQLPLIKRLARGRCDIPSESLSVKGVLELISQAWPLGLSGGITSLNGTLPRIVAFGTLGATAGGVMAMLSYPTAVLTLLGNSLGQTALGPMRSAREASDMALLRRIAARQIRLLWAVGATGILLLGIAGDHILRVALPTVEEDLTVTAILYLVAACVAASASISYYELTSTGTFRSHPVLSLGVLCISAPALLAGAHLAGLDGIALAMIIYFAVQYFAWTAISRRYVPENSRVSTGRGKS